MGVKHAILPKPGSRSKERELDEAQDWFQEGRNWHAGLEGQISVLKRSHVLGRCLNNRLTGFERWIGWGMISTNLRVMARTKLEVYAIVKVRVISLLSVQTLSYSFYIKN